MPKLNFYAVAVLNDNEEILRVFDGRDYVADLNSIKLFPANQVIDARKEAGSQQRLNENDEVRSLKISVDIPLQLAPPPPTPELGGDDDEDEA